MKPHPVDALISPPRGPAPAGWVCRWPLPAYCRTSPPPARPSEDAAGEVGALLASPHHAAIGLVKARQEARAARALRQEAGALRAELQAIRELTADTARGLASTGDEVSDLAAELQAAQLRLEGRVPDV